MSQATLRDLCAEAINVDGTGDATFHGALRGHRTFAAAYAGALPLSGVRIKIEEANAQGYIVRWEDSECTVTEAGFTRDTCINSSNNGAFEEFGAGYKRAFVFIPVADVGGGAATGAVRYDVAQTLDSVEKVQAQTNIGLNLADPVDSFWTLAAGSNGLRGDTAMCSGAAKVVSLRVFGASGLYTTNQDVANLPGAVDRLENDTDPLDAPIYILSGQTNTGQNGARSAIIGGVGTWHVGVFVITAGAHIGEVWACYEGVATKLPTTAGGVQISGTPAARRLGEWTDSTTQRASVARVEDGVAGGWSWPYGDVMSFEDGPVRGGVTNGNGGINFFRRGSGICAFIGEVTSYGVFLGNEGLFSFGVSRSNQAVKVALCKIDDETAGVTTDQYAPHAANGKFAARSLRTELFTVGTLPIAPTVNDHCSVTDALAPVMFAAVASGGSVLTDVKWNGSNWQVTG